MFSPTVIFVRNQERPIFYGLKKSGTFDVTNRILRDNETKMFKTHTAGANGIPNLDTRVFANCICFVTRPVFTARS